MLTPPEAFGCVEDGVYRCTSVDALSAQFLQTLGIRTVISLNPEKPSKLFRTVAQEKTVQLIHLGLRPWRPSGDWMVLSADLIQDSLTYTLDKRNHPILILDSTNAFVGVLRRLQHWNYSSVVGEYRAYSGGKSHYFTEVFLEMIELKCLSHEEAIRRRNSEPKELKRAHTAPASLHMRVDQMNCQVTVSLPPEDLLPDWFVRQRDLWNKELLAEQTEQTEKDEQK